MTGEPLLSVSDLKVRFRIGGFMAALAGQPTEIEAVAGVSCTLERGRTFALVGESGSGKTTLARAVNGCRSLLPVGTLRGPHCAPAEAEWTPPRRHVDDVPGSGRSLSPG